MPFRVRVRGGGRVEVAAYGLSDAEHLVEKELSRLLPGAAVEVLEVRRPDERSRIVETYAVAYRLAVTLEVDAAGRDGAPAAAFRHARGLLSGSRYAGVEWEKGSVVD